MKGALILGGLVLLVAVAAVCASSRNPVLHLIGGLLLGLVSLALTATTVFLVSVGVKNHWTSDGPAMLLIMIGIGVFGAAALGGWMMTLGTFFGERR